MDDIKLCFVPHAGGSAISYTNFKKFLSSDIKPVPFELAGRGKRMTEECFTDVVKCAEDLFEQNINIFESGNYAIFGHSLGTIISFELASIIKHNGLPSPLHMFFSGRSAPQSEKISVLSGVSELSDEEFIDKFSVYGAIPEIIMKNHDILNMVLKIMRADVAMADSYCPSQSMPVLDCNISVFYGYEDKIYSGQDIDLWSACTTGKCSSYGFEGDHFYYIKPIIKQEVCNIINKILR